MLFRKKPVMISAFQLGHHWPMCEANEWFSVAVANGIITTTNMGAMHNPNKESSLTINTLEGTMHASMGDWIIRGVHGEIYPCKPDIFRETYVEVN